MTGGRDGSLEFAGDRRAPEARSGLRGAAAGVVTGLGAFFLVRHLASAGGANVPAALYHVPFLLLSVAMLYAGYWLLNCDADHRRVGRVALWSAAGFLALVAVGVWASGGRTTGVQAAARLALDVGTVGASSGLLVGLEGERRRRAHDRHTHRAADRADERLAFFNRLLRHHLLNGVAVVRGHAELLADTCRDSADTVDVIRQRCDEITDLVRSVETLSRASTGELAVRPTDPTPPLADAIDANRAAGARIEVVDDGRGGRPVLATEGISLVFSAVLDATVEAAVDDRVTVETATAGGEFRASFAFDGTLGLDPRGGVEPGEYGDEAFGLFLAETLLEYVGGSMELPADGPGSVLTIRLPLAG